MDKVFGARKQIKDGRDYQLVSTFTSKTKIPDKYELPRWNEIRVKSQGNVGSCVAHAMSSILEYYNETPMSTDFIYGAQYEAVGLKTSGMYLRDACKIAAHYGDCCHVTCPTNTEMPMAIAKFDAVSDDNKAVARKARILKYVAVWSKEQIQEALLAGTPVLFAIKWPKHYELDENYVLKQTQPGFSGGHGMVIYGWNEHGWLVHNSWGTWWGNCGQFILPYAYKIREAWSIVDDENICILHTSPAPPAYKIKFWDLLRKLISMLQNWFSK